MRSRRTRSTSKHSGALMSSRLMPPKVGSRAATHFDQLLRIRGVDLDVEDGRFPANFLNRTALPSITGFEANGPMLPSPSTAVPLVSTATRFCRIVISSAFAGSSLMARQAASDARGIGKRQVALRCQWLGGLDLEFAGSWKAMVVERGVGELVGDRIGP